MLNLKSGKHFTDTPTITRGGFLKGILASGIAPSLTLGAVSLVGSAIIAAGVAPSIALGALPRGLGARCGMMVSGGGGGGTYELCNYVATDGNAYIDLGWKPATKVGFEIIASGTYTGFSSWCLLFGALNSETSSTSFYSCTCFFGSMFDDRLFCYNQGLGTAGFWENNAYEGMVWLDGNFKTIMIPYSNSINNYNPYNLVPHINDTVNGSVLKTNSSIGGLLNTLPERNLTAFAVLGSTGTKFYQVPTSMNIKIKKLAFSDDTGVIADFRAAKQGSEYGLANIVDGTFHGGIGGTIIGA